MGSRMKRGEKGRASVAGRAISLVGTVTHPGSTGDEGLHSIACD